MIGRFFFLFTSCLLPFWGHFGGGVLIYFLFLTPFTYIDISDRVGMGGVGEMEMNV